MARFAKLVRLARCAWHAALGTLRLARCAWHAELGTLSLAHCACSSLCLTCSKFVAILQIDLVVAIERFTELVNRIECTWDLCFHDFDGNVTF